MCQWVGISFKIPTILKKINQKQTATMYFLWAQSSGCGFWLHKRWTTKTKEVLIIPKRCKVIKRGNILLRNQLLVRSSRGKSTVMTVTTIDKETKKQRRSRTKRENESRGSRFFFCFVYCRNRFLVLLLEQKLHVIISFKPNLDNTQKSKVVNSLNQF